MTMRIEFTLNGREMVVDIDVKETLLEVLRDRLHMTSVKQGCGVGECGACAVLIDGVSVNSCLYPAPRAHGRNIQTTEGLSEGEDLSVMQRSFIEAGAVQCGFCTPGLLMTATGLMEQKKDFSREEIKRELSGHLCRCTGYSKIVDAVEKGLESAEK